MLKHSQQGLITSQQEGERVETATTEAKQRRDNKAGRGLCEDRAPPWKGVRIKMKLDRRDRKVETKVQS